MINGCPCHSQTGHLLREQIDVQGEAGVQLIGSVTEPLLMFCALLLAEGHLAFIGLYF